MHTGLHLNARKLESTTLPIEPASVPKLLTLTIDARDAQLEAEAGQRILRGQLIAHAPDSRVHSSVSGTIVSIERFGPQYRVVIDNDGLDTSHPGMVPLDYLALDPAALRNRIADAGIRGLGGAIYPTAEKLAIAATRRTPLLIVNGAECEPFISCDDALMREHAVDVLLGTQVVLRAITAERALIAVESNKPQAILALRSALAANPDLRIEVRVVPTYYPAGGERQLIHSLTGKEVPSGGHPTDIGVLCQNAGTAAAIARLIRNGEPLLSRIVTITGSGVRQPRNLWARLGTPIASLIADCGGYAATIERLIMGGSMMGVALDDDSYEVTAATNCIIAATLHDLQPRGFEMPCIRCGACSDVCPAALLPQQLLRYARLDDRPALLELGLKDCIECGCCDYVCPSDIRLASTFAAAKQHS